MVAAAAATLLQGQQDACGAHRLPVDLACQPVLDGMLLSCAHLRWSSTCPCFSSRHPHRCMALADDATLYLGTNQGLLLRMRLRQAAKTRQEGSSMAKQPPPAAGSEAPAFDPPDPGDCQLVWRSPTGSHISSLVACSGQYSSPDADPGQLPRCIASCTASQGQPRSGGEAATADSAWPASAAGGRAVQDRCQPLVAVPHPSQLQQPPAAALDRGRTSPLHEPQHLHRAHRLLLGDQQGSVAFVEAPQQPSQVQAPLAGQAASPSSSCTGAQSIASTVTDSPTSSSSSREAEDGSSKMRSEDSRHVCAWPGHAGKAVLCTALADYKGEDHGWSRHPAGASANAAGHLCVWQMASHGGKLPFIASPSWARLGGQEAWQIISSKHLCR